MPAWTGPMLARLTHEAFSDASWIYERKLDGERCLAFCHDGQVTLLSRNRKKLNDTYPEIVEALAEKVSTDMILDGEIVAFAGRTTSFERLQQRMKIKDPEQVRQSNVAVYYYVFDVLHYGRYDTAKVRLRQRKQLLKATLPFDDPLRFTTHTNTDGLRLFKDACRKDWEGLIAKDARSTYAHSRSSSWLKFKCAHQQEFVIGGFTDPQGERVGFGALLIGYYDHDDLKYAGKVGTGYDEQALRDLHRKLARIETSRPAFADRKLPRKDIHWVKPRLVGEFAYTELTRENRLRHPRFMGLRRDKPPHKVHLEH